MPKVLILSGLRKFIFCYSDFIGTGEDSGSVLGHYQQEFYKKTLVLFIYSLYHKEK